MFLCRKVSTRLTPPKMQYGHLTSRFIFTLSTWYPRLLYFCDLQKEIHELFNKLKYLYGYQKYRNVIVNFAFKSNHIFNNKVTVYRAQRMHLKEILVSMSIYMYQSDFCDVEFS